MGQSDIALPTSNMEVPVPLVEQLVETFPTTFPHVNLAYSILQCYLCSMK